jgi:hypothetical protein
LEDPWPVSCPPKRPRRRPPRFEVVELFLGLRRDRRELGFQGENHRIFSTFDQDEMYARRGADYEYAKGGIADALLSGSIYGEPGTPERLRNRRFGTATPIRACTSPAPTRSSREFMGASWAETSPPDSSLPLWLFKIMSGVR